MAKTTPKKADTVAAKEVKESKPVETKAVVAKAEKPAAKPVAAKAPKAEKKPAKKTAKAAPKAEKAPAKKAAKAEKAPAKPKKTARTKA